MSWKRLGAGTAALFATAFAFLGGRLHAGADPAVGKATTQAGKTQSTTQQDQQSGSASTPSTHVS